MLKSLLRIPFKLIFLILYLLFLLGYGIALLSPRVSPLLTQVPAFFNLAFGVLFLALIVFLIYLLFHWRRSGLLLVFHLVLMALTADYITAFFPVNLFEGLSEKRDLRVMTYNVAHFSRSLTEDSEPYVVGVIKTYDPDLVCLQESIGGRSDASTVRWLRKYFRKADYPYVIASSRKGLALLSKYPVTEYHIVKYASQTNGSESYILDVNGKNLLLINNHLESYSLSDKEKDKYRGFLKTLHPKRLWRQIKEVKRRLSPNMNLRVTAAEVTHQDMAYSQSEFRPDYTIVLGDFNDTPMSYVYSTMRGNMKDAYQQVGFGSGITFNENLLPFRIDHVLYGGALEAKGGEIPWIKEASDHNPVIIDFVIK